ncbi:MAG: VanZ family protein [Gemmatimonadaceae bacterium]
MAAAVAVLAAIALLTLWPGRSEAAPGFSWCIVCGELGTLNILLNVALFVPFGASLAWGRAFSMRNATQALFASLLVSTSIELLQLGVIKGRDPSLSDVVANTLGGAMGASLAHEVAWSVVAWRRISWTLALVASTVLVFGQWAMQPSLPRETYYVQWLPERPAYVPFNGTVLAFALDSIQLRPGAVFNARTLPDEFLHGRMDLRVRVTPGSPPHGIALIARLAVASGEVLMLGRAEDALVFRYRANGARAGLRSPMVTLPRAFALNGDTALQLEAALRPGRVTLGARDGGEFRVARRLEITTARAWTLLLPWNLAIGGIGHLFNAAWLALLFGVVAYSAARARFRLYAAWPLEVLALVLIGLASIAPGAPEWTSWIGAIAGAALGFWLGARRVAVIVAPH